MYRAQYQLPAPIKDPAFAVVGAGRFALLGGLDSSEVSSATIELADLKGVVRTANLPLAQHDAQGAEIGGDVYVFRRGEARPPSSTTSSASTPPEASCRP